MRIRDIATIPITVAGQPFVADLDAGNASSLVLPKNWIDRMPLVEGELRAVSVTGAGRMPEGARRGPTRLVQQSVARIPTAQFAAKAALLTPTRARYG